jgi:hypothetical protein
MKLKSNVMTVVAGLALAAALPVQAQVLGGALGGAGNVMMGGGGIAGDASASGSLDSDLRDRVQGARERSQAAAESGVQHGQDAAASTRASAGSRVQKTSTHTQQAARNAGKVSGSAATSASAGKQIGKRNVQAGSSSNTGFSADRSGVLVDSSQTGNASVTRPEPAPAPGEPESAGE